MQDDCPKTDCDLAQIVLKETARIGKEIDDMRAEFKKAVPGGDFDGHRRYHDLVIERETQRIKLRQAIIEKTLTGLVWMGLCAIGLSIWQYFLSAVASGKIR